MPTCARPSACTRTTPLHFDDVWPQLEQLASSPGVVAVGEAGFDFHYLHSPADDQGRAFREQIRLAHRLDLALVIHSREAWDATFDALEQEGTPPRTVFHCFTGGTTEARSRARPRRVLVVQRDRVVRWRR